jgi:glycosyltransferase involved in cell wall biosynthesis
MEGSWKMHASDDLISICIPHWQVRPYISVCLRSIRKHSGPYPVEVIVVDNGSKDDSLDYLRSLRWIRLLERPEESHRNWPENVFTAWDLGVREAKGRFFMTMHSDVFVRSDDWLRPFLREVAIGNRVAGVGAWKLELEHPLYGFQKRFIGTATDFVKRIFGVSKGVRHNKRNYPRDYCALYRREAIIQHGLTFRPGALGGGGYSIARQLWDHGYTTRMIKVAELYPMVVHVAHGTAALVKEKPLQHKRAQRKVERKHQNISNAEWFQELLDAESWDHNERQRG